MKRAFLLALVLVAFFAVFGCDSTPKKSLKDFYPASLTSPDEIAVGHIVASFKKTYEERDFEANLVHYADNARIMTGGGEPVVMSKDEYAKKIHKRRQSGAKVSYKVLSWGFPKIEILGPDKAKVITVNKIRTKSGRSIAVRNDYRFTKISGKWLIEKYTYSW